MGVGQSPDVILVTCVRVTGTANVTGRCFDRTKGHRDTAVWATGPKEPQKEHRLHIQVVRETLAGIRVLSATPGTPRSRRPYWVWPGSRPGPWTSGILPGDRPEAGCPAGLADMSSLL